MIADLGFDVIFSGHQHAFSRTHAMNGAQVVGADAVEDRIDENGKTQYRITYTDKSENDEDWDAFMWQTIFMPVLNN